MRGIVTLVSAAVLSMLFLAVTDCSAQRGGQWARGSGWGGGYGRQYDVSTVDTISGEVDRVERFVRGIGYSSGTHIVVRTGSDTITVHVGPTWFVDDRDMTVAVGDSVEVVGSRIISGGMPAIVAVSVKRGDDVLFLRDSWGYPAWSGWRRGRWYWRPY